MAKVELKKPVVEEISSKIQAFFPKRQWKPLKREGQKSKTVILEKIFWSKALI